MREVFRTAGRTSVFTAASSSPGCGTGANSVVAVPTLRKRSYSAGRLGAEFSESFTDGGILRAEDGGGEERGIDRAGLADGECADRDTAGHLRNGEERIETLEGF